MITNKTRSQTVRSFRRWIVVPIIAVVVLLSHPLSAVAGPSELDVRGFFTFEYEISNKDAAGKNGTFDLHHFNILSNYRITDHSRVFGEIEWEHGAALDGDGGVGLVAVERAWFEYSFSDAFAIRVGKFLTPFGRYNQIHDATPTYTTTFLPQAIYGKHRRVDGHSHRLYTKFSAGIEITGRIPVSSWDFQYWAIVANGRGTNPYEVDDNSNKAVGGRVLFSNSNEDLSLGGSLYRDRNNEHHENAVEAAYTFEAATSVKGIHVEAEGALFHIQTGQVASKAVYTDKLGGYVQLEYYSGLLVSPVIRVNAFNPDRDTGNDLETAYTFGINAEVSENAFFKAEVHLRRFENITQDGFEMFVTSLAVAF